MGTGEVREQALVEMVIPGSSHSCWLARLVSPSVAGQGRSDVRSGTYRWNQDGPPASGWTVERRLWPADGVRVRDRVGHSRGAHRRTSPQPVLPMLTQRSPPPTAAGCRVDRPQRGEAGQLEVNWPAGTAAPVRSVLIGFGFECSWGGFMTDRSGVDVALRVCFGAGPVRPMAGTPRPGTPREAPRAHRSCAGPPGATRPGAPSGTSTASALAPADGS